MCIYAAAAARAGAAGAAGDNEAVREQEGGVERAVRSGAGALDTGGAEVVPSGCGLGGADKVLSVGDLRSGI